MPAHILVDPPSYRREAAIPERVRRSLSATLAGEPPSLMPAGAAAASPAEAPQVLFETARARVLGVGPGMVVEPRRIWTEVDREGSAMRWHLRPAGP